MAYVLVASTACFRAVVLVVGASPPCARALVCRLEKWGGVKERSAFPLAGHFFALPSRVASSGAYLRQRIR